MSVHRMPPRDEPFDPRQAALSHAGMAEQQAAMVGHGAPAEPMRLVGELASALACGLVYVGDQVKAAGPAPEYVGRWMDALRSIANYEESFGGPPPDDAMREIAVKALRGEDHGGAGE